MSNKFLISPLLLSLFFVFLAAIAHADDQWAVKRDATPEEQREVDEYRKGASWSLQLDFHDYAAARALFEPIADDVAWIKSCRQPENVEINGALRLKTKTANNCHAKWSTGYVVTKNWQQVYGFFETRMRITKKTGINNAFWLTGKDLEIDIVEANFPKTIHWGLHDWGSKPPRAIGCAQTADNLADQMNDYGLLWLPDRLIYTFNGKAVCTIETKFPSVPTEIRFSTAVGDFAGKIDDPTDSEMDVYWVHVAPLKNVQGQPK